MTKKILQKSKQSNPAIKVSIISIIVNTVLSVLKLVAGLVANSSAMVSDAIHSLSDVFSTIVVIIGIRISQKQADKEHPYGHDRLECVASILLAVILALTGIGIGISGLQKIFGGNYEQLAIPKAIALVAAVISIVANEWLFWYTKRVAKKINSTALMADAWHHRSDSLSSIGSFVGILGARLGFPVLDSIASVAICVCILKAAYDIFKDSLNKMVDHSCGVETELKIRELVFKNQSVLAIDDLKTREFGAKMYVDIEIVLDGEITLKNAHDIAEKIHDDIELNFVECKHCMVHVNPNTSDT